MGFLQKMSDPWVAQKLDITCEILLSENVLSDPWAVAPGEGVRPMGHGTQSVNRQIISKQNASKSMKIFQKMLKLC